jgi:putative NIF3 family GTP cyclohydrolase 1 type 2
VRPLDGPTLVSSLTWLRSLTTSVVEEALSTPTAFIISYHPPIFSPLRSLTLSNPLQASLLRCAAAGVSVYSPHTALDGVWGGVNDWLASGLSVPGEKARMEILGEKVEELGGARGCVHWSAG